MSFPRYAAYKDSGVEWLGEVPQGWEVKKLGQVAFMQEGPGLRTWQFMSEGIRVICVTNISENGIDFSLLEKFIATEEYHSSYQHFTVNNGDVLLSSSGNSWGKVAIYNSEEKVILNTSTIRLNESKLALLHRSYIAVLLKSNGVLKQLDIAMTGSCQPNFGPTHLSRVMVAVPPKNEQTTIAAFLDHETAKIDNLINEQKKLIELLKEKRQAVISTAVTKGLNPHAPMKDSGVEWLGEVPEHWTIAKVKYFAKMQGGYAFNSNDFKEDGVQLLRIGNVYLNCLELERQPIFVHDNFIESHKDFVVRFGDLLMSLTGTLGKTDYGYAVKVDVHQEFMLNQRLAKIMPNSKITNDYLLYSIRSEPYLRILYSLASGTKQANLSNDDILNIPIFVSPLPEQTTIVAFLDQETAKIDNLIQQAQKATTLLQERRTALISAAVTGKIDVRGFVKT